MVDLLVAEEWDRARIDVRVGHEVPLLLGCWQEHPVQRLEAVVYKILSVAHKNCNARQ